MMTAVLRPYQAESAPLIRAVLAFADETRRQAMLSRSEHHCSGEDSWLDPSRPANDLTRNGEDKS